MPSSCFKESYHPQNLRVIIFWREKKKWKCRRHSSREGKPSFLRSPQSCREPFFSLSSPFLSVSFHDILTVKKLRCSKEQAIKISIQKPFPAFIILLHTNRFNQKEPEHKKQESFINNLSTWQHTTLLLGVWISSMMSMQTSMNTHRITKRSMQRAAFIILLHGVWTIAGKCNKNSHFDHTVQAQHLLIPRIIALLISSIMAAMLRQVDLHHSKSNQMSTMLLTRML